MDKRRKTDLEGLDYQRIRYYEKYESTTRNVARMHGVTPKYVKKILTEVAPIRIDPDPPTEPATFECSGCHRVWTTEESYHTHLEIWTSGFQHDLDCWKFAPNHPKLAELR